MVAVLAVIFVLDVIVLHLVWTSGASAFTRAIWTAIVLLLPGIGLALWAFAGPKFRAPDRDRPI